jgi:hypothetical protein
VKSRCSPTASSSLEGGRLNPCRKTHSEVIPIKSISSVTVEKAGLGKRKVTVTSSGNTIEIEMNTVEKAEELKKAILGGYSPEECAP